MRLAAVLFLLAAPALAVDASTAAARLYEDGLARYAEDDLPGALASFQAALKRQPRHERAANAVRRLEHELASRPVARAADPLPRQGRLGAAVDRFFLVSLPRFVSFERSVGDRLRESGTVAALNGRVQLLLGERRRALALGRPFRKERQLRELLRRTVVSAGPQAAV